MVHFVNITGDRFWKAVKVFGFPDFVHPSWDYKAREDFAEGDTVVMP